MHKKKASWIRKYYKKREVVNSYNVRRFKGSGGKYVDRSEINSLVFLVKKVTRGRKHNTIRILDLGAGRGRLSSKLKRLGFDVYCMDASEEMSKFLLKHFSENKIITQSVFDLFKNTTRFDLIVSLRFLDHFSIKNQEKILKNCSKSLSKNGYIIYTGLNRFGLEGLLSRFFSYSKYNYYYKDSDYRKLFKKKGFVVKKKLGIFFLPRGFFLYSQKIPILLFFLTKVNDFFTMHFSIACSLWIYLLQKNEN